MMTVEDLMTEQVVTVNPDTPLVEAVGILTKRSFNGLPVIDKDGKFVGLLTERSMISDNSFVHLKTLLQLFGQIDFYKKDHNHPIREDLKKILDMKVSEVMDTHPTTIAANETVEKATVLLADPKVNPLPVVTADGRLEGILSLSDLTKLYGVNLRTNFNRRAIDEQVDTFIKDFEKQFVMVSKHHTRIWFFTSVAFAIIGFIIALLFILRVSV